MTERRFAFPKSARIRRTRDYQRVQRHGRLVRLRHLLVIYQRGRSEGSRVGLTVSRKVGGSVVRNQVKRWLKEAVRHERHRLVGVWDVVFIAKHSASTAGLPALRAEVIRGFDQIGRSSR